MEKTKTSKKDLDLSNVKYESSNKKSTQKKKYKTNKTILDRISSIPEKIFNIYDLINRNFIDKIDINPIRIMLRGIMGALLFLSMISTILLIPGAFIIFLWNKLGSLTFFMIICMIVVYFLGYKLDQTSNKKHKKEVTKNGNKNRRE